MKDCVDLRWGLACCIIPQLHHFYHGMRRTRRVGVGGTHRGGELAMGQNLHIAVKFSCSQDSQVSNYLRKKLLLMTTKFFLVKRIYWQCFLVISFLSKIQ